MKDYIKTSEFEIQLDRKNVLNLIDCYEGNPVYDDIIEEYGGLAEKLYSVISPAAIIKFGRLPDNSPVIYVLASVGDEVSRLSASFFEQGDYLAGMLIDAMADDYLFQMDDKIQKIIKEECGVRHIGVSKRLEAPKDIPMDTQKLIFEETNASGELGMSMTSGFMFTTIKTTCYLLTLTEDEDVFMAQHDCSNCDAVNCKMRKKDMVQITLMEKGKAVVLKGLDKESIYETFLRNGVYFNAACGGRGTCGKCKIQLLEGELEITPFDRKKFEQEELEKGYRLSCKAYPEKDCIIKLGAGNEADFEVLAEYETSDRGTQDAEDEKYVIGIDIGTTTVAVHLVGLKTGKTIEPYTTINKQRAYGSDVISRIQASNGGKKEALKHSIQKDLLEGIQQVILKGKIDKNLVEKIAIGGNTTMGHLLMGYSCEGLGVYPFTPVNIGTIEEDFFRIMGSDYLNIPVVLLPGISVFVGGDIVAGLLTCEFQKAKNPCVLIDLGTNGEMAIGNKDRILVSSTAAGPAFEGGNISRGVGSVGGAICNVTIEESGVSFQTIGNKPPVGICGTGVIEITSELVRTGLVDETGLLDEEYFDDGYEIAKDEEGNPIAFTQKDIREIQLAKSAVRAGMETLLRRYGAAYEDIDTVYLAGGFGYKINIEKAVYIGLLPKEFSGKVKTIGNSSLGGAVKYLLEEESHKKIGKILEIAKEVGLASDKDFNEFYMEHMFFGEE